MELGYLMVVGAIVAAIATFRSTRNRSDAPCKRCGAIGTTHPFRGTVTHPDFYRVPLDLCLTCTSAQESFIDHRSMLATESRLHFGRHESVAAARNVWGDRAVDMLALLAVAKED